MALAVFETDDLNMFGFESRQRHTFKCIIYKSHSDLIYMCVYAEITLSQSKIWFTNFLLVGVRACYCRSNRP